MLAPASSVACVSPASLGPGIAAPGPAASARGPLGGPLVALAAPVLGVASASLGPGVATPGSIALAGCLLPDATVALAPHRGPTGTALATAVSGRRPAPVAPAGEGTSCGGALLAIEPAVAVPIEAPGHPAHHVATATVAITRGGAPVRAGGSSPVRVPARRAAPGVTGILPPRALSIEVAALASPARSPTVTGAIGTVALGSARLQSLAGCSALLRVDPAIVVRVEALEHSLVTLGAVGPGVARILAQRRAGRRHQADGAEQREETCWGACQGHQ